MMRRFLLAVLFFTSLTPVLNAQWTSPGNGTTYTLADLVNVSNGTVSNGPEGYSINADLTISANDVLLIDDQASRIDIADILVTIKGSMTCTNNSRVGLYGLNETEHFKMRFENAIGCELKKLYFSDGGGIKVIASEVTFDDVKFLYFSTDYCNAVIDVFNCDPVIKNCHFINNQGAAISSPANGQSSPQILNNSLDANVNGLNSPQINLGPGGEDTIRIVGNEIDDHGATWHVGGISVADLMGVGSTKVLVKDNIVKEGRYGYNQQGANISSVITGNQFVDNFNEDNPMNGGSGISIYGTTLNNKAIIRNNLITGNLWGITAIYLHEIDLGTENEWGHNEIHDNGNSGLVYDLYNNSTCDIMAVGNNWGAADETVIEDHIVHQVDDPGLGLVTFIPYVGYEQTEETIDIQDINLSEAIVYTITGQRVSHPEMLKPGVYILLTEQGTQKIILK